MVILGLEKEEHPLPKDDRFRNKEHIIFKRMETSALFPLPFFKKRSYLRFQWGCVGKYQSFHITQKNPKSY